MSSIIYYSVSSNTISTDINGCSVASCRYPISVNCAGSFSTSFPFTTDNPMGRNDYYLLYIVRGEMELSAGDLTANAVAGSIFLIPPHIHYTYSYSGKEPLNYLWVHFTGSYADGLLKDCGLYPLPYQGYTENSSRIARGFKKLFEEFEQRSELFERKASVYLQDIIMEIAEDIHSEKESKPLEASIRYIHSAYDKKLSIPTLAAMENLSNSRYITLFNKLTGMSPTAYIIRLRMNTACELLLNTDMSIKQIGILSGYSDAHFFSKLFKKHMGVSPNEYRNNN